MRMISHNIYDNNTCSHRSWHNTWQLAVVLAEAMNRKGSISQADAEAMAMEVHRKNSQASMAK